MRNTILLSSFLFFFLFLLIGCVKLELDGNTFYTISGRITDTTNRAMKNFQVAILNEGPNYGYWGAGGHAISALGYTDVDGNFKLTFPSNNGSFYLQLEANYYGTDSINGFTSLFTLSPNQFQNYFCKLKTIKVYKP